MTMHFVNKFYVTFWSADDKYKQSSLRHIRQANKKTELL